MPKVFFCYNFFMVDFPFLKQKISDFPCQDVDNYAQWQNSFDYDSYTGELDIRLVNVKWYVGGEDRPCFDSETDRDDYFSGLSGFSFKSKINLIPQTTIKLPVPYNNLMNYNYLVVDAPLLPGTGSNLAYSGSTAQKYYYFITEINYLSPSTTECVLEMDFWTTFQHKVNIPRIQLYRGHLPQTYTTVSTFLGNPINNTRGLLYPEPDMPDAPVKVAKNNFYPFASSEIYAVIAWKTSPERMESLTAASGTSSWGLAYDINTQYLNPSPGYAAPPGGEIIPNGYGMTGIPASNLETFCVNLSEQYQSGLNYIQAIFLLPRSFIRISSTTTRNIAGVTHYYVTNQGSASLASLSFSASDFGYSSNYSALTKLYTSPYSWISVTNMNGEEITIGVEETTNDLGISANVNLLYPYLSAYSFLTGVGGSGSVSYTFRGINGSISGSISDSGYRYILEKWDIPCYQLMVAANQKWNAENNSSSVYQAQRSAQNSYDNTVRSASAALSNTQATNSTNLANTQRSNTTKSQNVVSQISTKTELNNLATSNASDLTTLHRGYLYDTCSWANEKVQLDNGATKTYLNSVFQVQQEVGAIAGTTGAISSVMGGISGGNIGSALGGLASASLGMANMYVTLTSEAEVNTLTNTYNDDNVQNQIYYNRNMSNCSRTYNQNATDTNNEYSQNVTDVENELTQTVTDREISTSNTNASNSASTSNSNASRTYNATVNNASVILQQKQDEYQAKYRDLRRQIVSVCQDAGDAAPDALGLRGAQVKILTQQEDIIKRCGDMFLRYGYSTNEVVENPSWNVKTKFTYWQGEATVYGACPVSGIMEIKNMFEKGVTFWRDPDEIGASIYSN